MEEPEGPSPPPPPPVTALEAAARGGHIRGDFPRYYDFHSTAPRVQALLGDAEARRVLAAAWGEQGQGQGPGRGPLLLSDFGSNAGDLTVELARQLRALVVGEGGDGVVAALGLELNAGLVKRARELAAKGGEGMRLEFEALDVVAEEARARELVQAFVGKYRPEESGRSRRRRVDVLTIFSTTMWVHLAHGDEGLRRLLRTAASLARCLVVEPQGSQSYRNARKRLRRMDVDPGEHFREDLDPRLRTSEGLAALLLSCSSGDEKDEEGGCFNRWKDVGKSSSWGRDLLLFWREGAEVQGAGTGTGGTGHRTDEGRRRMKNESGWIC